MLKKELEEKLSEYSQIANELNVKNTELSREVEDLLVSRQEFNVKYKEERNKNIELKKEISLLCNTHLKVMYPVKTTGYNPQYGTEMQEIKEDEHYRFIKSLVDYCSSVDSVSRNKYGM